MPREKGHKQVFSSEATSKKSPRPNFPESQVRFNRSHGIRIPVQVRDSLVRGKLDVPEKDGRFMKNSRKTTQVVKKTRKDNVTQGYHMVVPATPPQQAPKHTPKKVKGDSVVGDATVTITQAVPQARKVSAKDVQVGDKVFDVYGGEHSIVKITPFKKVSRFYREDGAVWTWENGDTVMILR